MPGGATYTDPNLGNNSATDTNTQGTPQIDLAVTKTDGQTSYVPGAPVTYTIEVTNAGPSTANGFAIADLVPASITTSRHLLRRRPRLCGTNATVGNTVALQQREPRAGRGQPAAITISGTVSPNIDRRSDEHRDRHGPGGGAERHGAGEQQRERHRHAGRRPVAI